MQFQKNARELIDKYDSFILDIWGVIHDGIKPYEGVRETLKLMQDARKNVIFVSNTPRRAADVKKMFEYK